MEVRTGVANDAMTADLLAADALYLPGGSVWQWTLPADLAFVVERGEGSRIYGTHGRSYIDYVSSGPLLLGHAHPAIVRAVQEQVAKGTSYHWLSVPTIRLAEEICRAVPCAEKVRFVSTGTEATMFAMRMAREGYPGWKPNLDSPILKVCKTTYKSLYAKDPLVKAIHAGLECGIIGEKYPGIDMVSFGPTLEGVHSPDEKIHIDTADKFWNFTLAVLRNVA